MSTKCARRVSTSSHFSSSLTSGWNGTRFTVLLVVFLMTFTHSIQNVTPLDCRKYAFAPKCRGTTSKRSVPSMVPNDEDSPIQAVWAKYNEDLISDGQKDRQERITQKPQEDKISNKQDDKQPKPMGRSSSPVGSVWSPTQESIGSHVAPDAKNRNKRSSGSSLSAPELPTSFSSFAGKRFSPAQVDPELFDYYANLKRALPDTFSSFVGKRSGPPFPGSFSSFSVKRSSLPSTFSSFAGKRSELPSTFSSFAGKRTNELPDTFSGFAGKRPELPTSFSTFAGKRSQLPTSFSSFAGKRNPLPSTFSSFAGKRNPLPSTFSSFAGKRSQLPSTFSSFAGKRSQLPSTFSSFAGKRSSELPASFSTFAGKRNNGLPSTFSTFAGKRAGAAPQLPSTFSSFNGKRSSVLESEKNGLDQIAMDSPYEYRSNEVYKSPHFKRGVIGVDEGQSWRPWIN